jgi:hypothetical protein
MAWTMFEGVGDVRKAHELVGVGQVEMYLNARPGQAVSHRGKMRLGRRSCAQMRRHSNAVNTESSSQENGNGENDSIGVASSDEDVRVGLRDFGGIRCYTAA